MNKRKSPYPNVYLTSSGKYRAIVTTGSIRTGTRQVLLQQVYDTAEEAFAAVCEVRRAHGLPIYSPTVPQALRMPGYDAPQDSNKSQWEIWLESLG